MSEELFGSNPKLGRASGGPRPSYKPKRIEGLRSDPEALTDACCSIMVAFTLMASIIVLAIKFAFFQPNS